MYESHYHLGLALQYVGEHRRAITQLTNALDAVFIPKVSGQNVAPGQATIASYPR